MRIARVVGNVWATRKHSTLDGLTFLLVQPLAETTGEVDGDIALAVDGGFGSGPGDTVLLVDEGGAARQMLKRPKAPIRLVVSGIVDSLSLGGKDRKFH